MKTDDLIALLSIDAATPVPPENPAKRIFAALGVGVLVSAVLMLVVLGPRPDLAEAMRHSLSWGLKVELAIALAFPAIGGLSRLALPGRGMPNLVAIIIPVMLALFWLMAGSELAAAPAAERAAMVWGQTWRVCTMCIVMVSAPVFVAMVVALRGLAPVRLHAAGACAGLLSGCAGVFVYAFHCPETSMAFVMTWYVSGIAVVTLLGALLGPRLLRW
jgi:hypothetical protein